VVGLEARRRLERRAVTDASLRLELALHGARRVGALQRLRHRQRSLSQVRLAGTERRRDTLAEVEVQVPRLEVLEQMRDVHARALPEVVLRPEVDEAERLVIRDQPRPERVLLCGGEPEEELRRGGDEI